MKKELFFDKYCKQQFAAVVEDGKLAEFSIEGVDSEGTVGTIYKGRVASVHSGMNAAFISCGLPKNCYLSTEESYTDYTKYDGTFVKTDEKPLELTVGQEIIVQVTQPARGNKGAKVTTHLSFVGKRIIYLPNTDFLGISRKITDEKQRERLLKLADKLRKDNKEGFIVRTVAQEYTPKQIKAEAVYLKKLYRKMCKELETATVGSVLYKDEELPVRVLRDAMDKDVSAIHVADDELYDSLSTLIDLRGEFPKRKLIKYKGKRSMFKEYRISHLLYDLVSPVVELPSGGSLVIEHTEAMTVIDVNSGRFMGETELEETVFAVNLQAAQEIAHQVRLRNIGGIITVDFIDMQKEEHRRAVTEMLQACLSQDKAKCNVLEMNEFCITQFTRKRVGADLLSFLVKPCPYCNANGHVHGDIYVQTRLRSAILDCFAAGYTAAIVHLNIEMMHKILNGGLFTKEVETIWQDKRVYLIPHRTYGETQFDVHGENASVLNLPDNAQILY